MARVQEIEIAAEMVANVLSVDVATGDAVAIGDTVVLLESMKMEIPVISEYAGDRRRGLGDARATSSRRATSCSPSPSPARSPGHTCPWVDVGSSNMYTIGRDVHIDSWSSA